MSDDGSPRPGGDTRPDPAPPARTGGWTRAILIGSLVLNLVLLGAIAGAGLNHRMAPERRAIGDAGLGPIYEALPAEAKRALRREMLANLRDRGEIRQAVIADTRAFLAALRGDPFDRAAAEQALGRQRDRAARMLEIGADRIVERLEAMGPEARRAYADALEAAIRRRAPLRARD